MLVHSHELLSDHLVRIQPEQRRDTALDLLEVGLRDERELARLENRVEAIADLELEVPLPAVVVAGDRAAEIAVP